MARVMKYGFRSVMGKNIRYIKYKYGLCDEDIVNKSLHEVKQKCVNKWMSSINPEYVIHSTVIYDSVLMRDSNIYNFLQINEAETVINYLCTLGLDISAFLFKDFLLLFLIM